MSMPPDIPYISITKGGTVYDLPVQLVEQRGELKPVAISRNLKISFPPPISVAGITGGESRRNYDIDEVILDDWSRGMGVDIYPPAAPPNGFQVGDLDSRVGGYLTPPLLGTDLGTVASTAQSKRFLEPNYTDARLLTWATGSGAYRYDPSPSGWSAVQSGGSDMVWYDATIGLGFTWAVGYTGAVVRNVYRTADGVTWTALGLGAMTLPGAIACFDERVWALDANIGSLATPYFSTNAPTAGGGAATWTAGNTFRMTGQEWVQRLFVWVYPPDRGRTTLWCLTRARLLYYDYYAATPTWVEWFVFRSPLISPIGATDAYVWPKNNNLYVSHDLSEYVVEFTGNTVTNLPVNKGGGMPGGRRLAPRWLGGDDDFLYAFCILAPNDPTSVGGIVAMAEGGSFHPIYRPTAAGHTIGGGGAGKGKIWAPRHETGTPNVLRVLEFNNIDPTLAPHLTTARTYDSASWSTTTGWLNGGLRNVNKRLLYFEVDAIKADGAPGLDTGCTIQIEYCKRGGSFVSAGTLTDASTFPAVLAISGGFGFKELQVRITLQRGSTATQAPFLKTLKIGYRPRPKQRFTLGVRVDVRDSSPAYQTVDGKFRGMSASTARAFLDELADHDDAGQDDPLVGLSYGGGGNLIHPRYRSYPSCEVLVQSQESPDHADGLFLLTFNDISAPSSG